MRVRARRNVSFFMSRGRGRKGKRKGKDGFLVPATSLKAAQLSARVSHLRETERERKGKGKGKFSRTAALVPLTSRTAASRRGEVSLLRERERERKVKGQGKGKGKGKEKKAAPDVSPQVEELSLEVPEDVRAYFKKHCELILLEYGDNPWQMSKFLNCIRDFCCREGTIRDIVVGELLDLAFRRPGYVKRDMTDAEALYILNKIQARTLTEPCNPSQEKAVLAAVSRTLCLIQGPPGTGKTKVGALVAKVIEDTYLHVWKGHPWLMLTTADVH